MRNIAIIPARSGSKGLQDKNIKMCNGKPLLAYSIDAARLSGCFDIVHVSTDSEEYARIAHKHGADVPFLRNRETAEDTSSTWDAVRYVLEQYKERGLEFDTVAVLQPTSPLRTEKDICNAYDFFIKKEAKMISSVCEMEHSPLWSNTLPENYSMENFEDEDLAFVPRQSLPTYYRECGAIYILRTEQLYKDINIYKDACYAFVMEQKHSVDIDNELDFLIAETIMKADNIV